MTISKTPFPRGFIWGKGEDCPPGFVPTATPFLYAAEGVQVASASDQGTAITIVGLCVGTLEHINDPASYLLASLQRSDHAFLDAMDKLCGRYLIIRQRNDEIDFFNDATGMRATFYRSDFSAVASHAQLLTDEAPQAIPFRTGFPGNGTPFKGIKILTPNTALTIQADGGRVWRYWPRAPFTPLTPEEAATAALDFAATAIRKIKLPMRLALTAGFDSRVMLTTMLRSGVPFRTYTYKTYAGVDIAVGRELAGLAGVTHELVNTAKPEGEIKDALAAATYSNHHHWAVAGLVKWFPPNEVAVTANLLEIGRCYYSKYKKAPEPTSAEGMLGLHKFSMRTAKEEIAAFDGSYDDAVMPYYRDFLESSDYNAPRAIIDPYDQFYWEHRMGTWHGPNMNERDYYAEAFIPFNSRVIFEAMLGVPYDDRKEATTFKAMIATNEAMASIPINPTEWPPANASHETSAQE